ncbi:MAG: hypothetical protein AMXMBFR61_20370 [Fimbriimonadales bacterium]
MLSLSKHANASRKRCIGGRHHEFHAPARAGAVGLLSATRGLQSGEAARDFAVPAMRAMPLPVMLSLSKHATASRKRCIGGRHHADGEGMVAPTRVSRLSPRLGPRARSVRFAGAGRRTRAGEWNETPTPNTLPVTLLLVMLSLSKHALAAAKRRTGAGAYRNV